MDKQRQILIVNDDGIEAPGIILLAGIAKAFGEVTVVAPASQCSAMSQKLTIYTDLVLARRDFPVPGVRAFSVTGTPADCVKVALHFVCERKPDVIFSGINHGINSGYDIAYSGTMGAAMEGLMNGIPAIAFSSDHRTDLSLPAEYIAPILEELLPQPLSDAVWNVNFPRSPDGECKGILRDRKVAHMQMFLDNYLSEEQADGSLRVTPRAVIADVDMTAEGTDLNACLNGYISVGKVFCSVL